MCKGSRKHKAGDQGGAFVYWMFTSEPKGCDLVDLAHK